MVCGGKGHISISEPLASWDFILYFSIDLGAPLVALPGRPDVIKKFPSLQSFEGSFYSGSRKGEIFKCLLLGSQLQNSESSISDRGSSDNSACKDEKQISGSPEGDCSSLYSSSFQVLGLYSKVQYS